MKLKWSVVAKQKERGITNTCSLDASLILIYYMIQYIEKLTNSRVKNTMLQFIQKGLNENTTDTLRRDILRFEPKDKTDSRSAVYTRSSTRIQYTTNGEINLFSSHRRWEWIFKNDFLKRETLNIRVCSKCQKEEKFKRCQYSVYIDKLDCNLEKKS